MMTPDSSSRQPPSSGSAGQMPEPKATVSSAPFGSTDNLERLQDMASHPGAYPGAAAKSTGVRKVNNLPIYIAGVVVLMFLGIMAYVAQLRSASGNGSEEDEAKPQSAMTVASQVAGDAPLGFTPPPPAASEVMVASANLDAPPKPPGDQENATRIHGMKVRLFEEAVRAKTKVGQGAPRSEGSPPPSNAPDIQADPRFQPDSIEQRLAALKRNVGSMAPDAASSLMAQGMSNAMAQSGIPNLNNANNSSTRNNISQYDNTRQGKDAWALNSQIDLPRTPYVLRTGFVIPATLISGINSDLPGQIIGQVAQNVYDTPTGKHVLIPQGTRLVGVYVNDLAFGQERVMVAWQRLIFPDGKALDIGSMPGADQAGYAGYSDKVNQHLMRAFGSAFLLSGITAAVTSTQNNSAATNPNGSPTFNAAMGSSLGQHMGELSMRILEKYLNVSPTLEIRPGFRMNVVVTKDMTFSKPYQAFDY